ncbi:MAG: IS3 family transposase [Polyangiaceae bacterium]|nr:IS3 family transposase [Polyangiaceae bacterium]
MKYAFIAEKQVAFPVAALCRVLAVSRSGFYDFVAEPETERVRRDSSLAAKTRAVFAEHQGRYGSPRVCRELRHRGDAVSEKTVARLMRENGLVARRKKRFRATTDSKHEDPIAPNLLARDFTASGPNEAWVTDVTAVWTLAGWLFVAAILDLYSRRVVGWATSANNDRDLALDALRAALTARRPPPGLVHHSDRGSPYASADYRRALDRAGAVASMSRKGDCWDNAVAESFFATLKTEALGDRVPADHDLATHAIGEYLDGYYNPKCWRASESAEM